MQADAAHGSLRAGPCRNSTAHVPPPLPPADTALSSDNRFLLYSSITPEVHLVSGQPLVQQCTSFPRAVAGNLCTKQGASSDRRAAAARSWPAVCMRVALGPSPACLRTVEPAGSGCLVNSPALPLPALVQVNVERSGAVESVANVTDIHETLDLAGAPLPNQWHHPCPATSNTPDPLRHPTPAALPAAMVPADVHA